LRLCGAESDLRLPQPKIETEPWLELLPLVKLTGKPDSRMKNGRNPRQIHFQIREDGNEIWVRAKMAEIVHFPRSEQLSLRIASDFSLSQAVLDDLIQWRAERYLRTAFPDAFENAFRPLTDRFAKAIGVHDRAIDSIPSVSVTFARDGGSTRPNAMGRRPMRTVRGGIVFCRLLALFPC
jgi:hypothetical protein